MLTEKKRLYYSLFIPVILVIILWLIKLVEEVTGTDFASFGIYPRKLFGLWGILFSPLLHSNWAHLYANTIPLLILSTALFYFYKDIGLKIFLLIYFTTNILVWIMAREAYHIGASGLVYGFTSFLLLSGIIRRHNRLMALSIFILFLYGSIIWGAFPNFYPDKDISWEAHMMGLISGIIYAIIFRKEGPQRPVYHWDEDEEDVNNDGLVDDYYLDIKPESDNNMEEKTEKIDDIPKFSDNISHTL